MITYEEAARMVEAEGRLARYSMCDFDGLRCAAGVIRKARRNGGFPTILSYDEYNNLPDAFWVTNANDAFDGTPEERATYMAAWFRSRGDESC